MPIYNERKKDDVYNQAGKSNIGVVPNKLEKITGASTRIEEGLPKGIEYLDGCPCPPCGCLIEAVEILGTVGATSFELATSPVD